MAREFFKRQKTGGIVVLGYSISDWKEVDTLIERKGLNKDLDSISVWMR